MASMFRPSSDAAGERQTVIFMGFVNRSGSNHLAELMETTGRTTYMVEALTTDWLTLNARKGQSIPEYFLAEQARLGGATYGLKITGTQLLYLHHLGCLDKVDAKLVTILRRDRITQAVSLYLARSSGLWHDGTAVGVPYNAQGILDALNGILDMERWLDIAVTLTGLHDHRVYYEDLLSAPVDQVEAVMGHLGFGRASPCPSLLRKFRKQTGELNREFAHRFREDLATCEIEWIGPHAEAGSVTPMPMDLILKS